MLKNQGKNMLCIFHEKKIQKPQQQKKQATFVFFLKKN